MKPEQIRLNHLRQQVLVHLDSQYDNISRLATSLPTDSDDSKLVVMVLSFVGGYILERRADAADLTNH